MRGLTRRLILLSLLLIGSAGIVIVKGQVKPAKVLVETQEFARGLLIPHHLVAEPFSRLGLATLAKAANQPQLLYLIVPNHFEVGNAQVITSSKWLTETALPVDECIRQEILKLPFARKADDVVENEHAVTDTMPLISSSFEKVSVLPLLISSRIKDIEINLLVSALSRCDKTAAIAAIDFSHYLPMALADKRDVVTWQLIKERDYGQIRNLSNEYIDAPAGLIVWLKLMESWNLNKLELLAQENSGHLLKDPTAASTSYFVAIMR